MAEADRAFQEALAAVQEARADLRDAVDTAREHGRTWTEVGAALRVTKQAAWERFR